MLTVNDPGSGLGYVLSACVLLASFNSPAYGTEDPEAHNLRHQRLQPEFAGPIDNLTVPVGKEVSLSCVVNNLGEHKVGWLRSRDQTILTLHTRVVTHSPRISISFDNHRTFTLHISRVKESDKGCYMCQVNTPEMKKQSGCIDVHVPPDIISEYSSSDTAVNEGDNVTLSCHATGHPQPIVTWRRENGEPMLIRKNVRDLTLVDVHRGKTLFLWKVDRRQMGAYLCIAANEVPPAVSKRVIVSVNFQPTIVIPNQLVGSPLGKEVHLECYAEAYPKTINYWVKNRGEILLEGTENAVVPVEVISSSDSRAKYTIQENRSVYKVYMSLFIKDFNMSDVGTYNCVATNSLGRAEATIRLYNLTGAGGSGQDHPEDSENSARCSKHSIRPFLLILCLLYVSRFLSSR
nr:PREDICTED: lachesin-like isoform X1 [Bemisia tabaci]